MVDAETCYPNEACGFVAGLSNTVGSIFPVTNLSASPNRFQMKPDEQISTMHHIDAMGLAILGIYHSHPTGPDTPSTVDIDEFHYPGILVIICSCRDQGWVVRAYSIHDKLCIPVPIIVSVNP